ncbi:MAG: hypothetical protein WBN93_06290 [Acidimicrobiia bacterium]
MSDELRVGAVFDDRAAAEAAVVELRRHGWADDHLGVAIRQADPHVFEEDVGTDISHGAEKGIAVGAPIGAIAGMVIMAFAIPGAGLLGVGGILAAGGIPGALAGTYFGALLGIAAEEHELDEEWDWERVPLEPGQVLVVVAGHGHPDEVTDILGRNGGHVLSKPPHLG